MRLLLLYTGFGGRWEGLRPVGSNGRAEFAITPESLTFPNSSLEPLKKYSSKMMVLRGLATTAALLPNDPTRPLESRTLYLGHEHTCPTFFTGSAIRDVGGQCMPYSASLDYELGQHLGSGAAVRSIQLGIGCGSGNNHLDSLAFDRAGQRLPGFSNPADAYRQLFGNTVGGTGSTDAQRLKGQKSVLAAVQSSARRLRSRLATAEKVKLDDHLAALADIETRLGMTQYAPISCTSPTAPSLNRPGSGDTLPADTQIHFDLLTQAFACDRTRFVNAGWGNLGYGKLPWLFSDVDDMHGAVAHVTEDQTALGATARLRVAQLQNWYASRLCELMDRLNAVPESNGTLLGDRQVDAAVTRRQAVQSTCDRSCPTALRKPRSRRAARPGTRPGWE